MQGVILSIKEVAETAKLTKQHVRQLLREGKIKGTKVGKEWRVSKEDLNRYLGIEDNAQSMEKDLYIKELEGRIKTYEVQMTTLKNLVNTLNNIVKY